LSEVANSNFPHLGRGASVGDDPMWIKFCRDLWLLCVVVFSQSCISLFQ